MITFFNEAQEEKQRERLLEQFENELYNLMREVAYSVKLILTKRESVVSDEKQIVKLEKKLPTDGKKLSPEAQAKYKELKQEIDGYRFKINQTKNGLKKLYEEISIKGNSIKSFETNIIFIRNLRLVDVPKLDYVEINNTRYVAEDNMPKLDENGIMILYVENHPAKTDAKA